eukprot:COSAG04_NODE_9134_length_894_cov_8.774843_2_plen_78_part_00
MVTAFLEQVETTAMWILRRDPLSSAEGCVGQMEMMELRDNAAFATARLLHAWMVEVRPTHRSPPRDLVEATIAKKQA